MKAIRLLLTAILALWATGINAHRLVDGTTLLPLPLASVVDCHGNLVGMTDDEGEIPPVSAERYPLTFSYLGYEPQEISQLVTADIALQPLAFNLQEMTVSPGSHPLLHLTGYMREVSSLFGSADSITICRESIVDFMVPAGKTKVKGWKKPRTLASKTYVRMTGAGGKDSVSDHTADDYLLWGDRLGSVPTTIKVPERVQDAPSVVSDTTMGKYGPKIIWQKSSDTYRCRLDGLADHEGHIFTPWALKVLGITTDITDWSHNYALHPSPGTSPSLADMTGFSLSLDLRIRSKLLQTLHNSKEPLNQKSYIEVYITDREYLTEEDAKLLKKEPPVADAADVMPPPEAPALHPGVRQIVERVENQSKK